MDLALNNLQRLICHKTQQTKPNIMYTNTNMNPLFLGIKIYYLYCFYSSHPEPRENKRYASLP